MGKPGFSEIWKWGIITVLTGLLGFAMSDLQLLGAPEKYYWLIYGAIAFFVSLAIVQFIWTTIPKIIYHLKTPNRKNLHLYKGSRHGDVFTLKFISTEWRHLFKETDVSISIPAQYLAIRLKWRGENTAQPITIRRFKFYEINFLQVNREDDNFRLMHESIKQPFETGRYVFEMQVATEIFIGEERVFVDRVFDVIVVHKGGNQVEIKTRERVRRNKR